MASFKMATLLLCILLIGRSVNAVVNKPSSETKSANEEEKQEETADDRIGDTYLPPPSSQYGAPATFNGPAPVYGPPELTGDYRQPQVFPPPPAELPPSAYGPPAIIYGPSRKPKPQYLSTKQVYGPPPSLPPKANYGPPKSNYGPPQQVYGPPIQHGSLKSLYGPPQTVFTSLRPPRPHFGPSKFNAPPGPQYGSPAPAYGPPAPVYGPPAPQYGPPTPQYGPPALEQGPSFLQHGPPAPQYGSPALEHGPSPLLHPLPLSAPGLGQKSSHSVPIPLSLEAYGPPKKQPQVPFFGQQNEYSPLVSNRAPQHELSNLNGPPPPPVPGAPAPPTPPEIKYDGWQPIAGLVSSANQAPSADNNNLPGRDFGQAGLDFNSGIPSDSYGVPLNNAEDHNLKTSVSHSSTTADESGLPPPSLPEFEPLHNAQDSSFKNVAVDQHQSDVRFAKQNGNINVQSNLNVQPTDSYGAPAIETSHTSISNGNLQIGGQDDFSLQRLPYAPETTYGPPTDVYVPPPPPSDTYAAPPASSYSPNGLYAPNKSHRGTSLPSLNSFITNFRKHVIAPTTNIGQSRAPAPIGTLIPPKYGSIKFRDSVPTGLFSNLNGNVPSFPSSMKPSKNVGPPMTRDQQLPTLNGPVAFHATSNSFAAETSVAKNNIPPVSSPLAAPNVNYGTPLSFNNFNGPAPTVTYGAPNFLPPSTFQASSTGFGDNLYSNIGNADLAVYGTPMVSAPGPDCVFPKPNNFQYFDQNAGNHIDFSNQHNFNSQPVHVIHSGPQVLSTSPNQVYETSFNNFNTGGLLPPVNELHLEQQEQQRNNLRDSYGNLIDGNYAPQDLTGSNTNNAQATSAELVDSSVRNQNSFATGSSSASSEGITSEQLTAALTAQGYGEARHIVRSEEVDPNQFLSTQEGSQALSLVQGLNPDGSDGFQIHGSQGTYTLQIQSANGAADTENSDGSIKHEHVLSNGLLQDILAVIEQPQNRQAQLQSEPQEQQLQSEFGDLSQAASSAIDKIEEYDRLQSRSDNISQSTEKSNDSATLEDNSEQGDAESTTVPAKAEETEKKETKSTTKSEKQKEARSRLFRSRS